MSITGQTEPPGGREIVHAELRDRAHHNPNGHALRTGAPLPIYHIEYAHAQSAKPLLKAKMSGWRYPVIGGEAPKFALLRKSQSGLAFAGLGDGVLAHRVINAALLAEKYLASHSTTFEPRLLEIPSLHLYALWLYAPRGKSCYVLLPTGENASDTTLHIEENIESHIDLRIAAEASRARKERERPAPVSCGLVMPVSGVDGCDTQHWAEVRTILVDTIEEIHKPKFGVEFLAEANDEALPHRRLRDSIKRVDVAICDLSGKDANVTLALGLRLALAKPTVLIMDDKTAYMPDALEMEHILYPRDLRYSKIIAFKSRLVQKLVSATGSGE